MNLFDLVKATVVCGGLAFLVYSFPVVSQIGVIALLSLLWLLYAQKAIAHFWRR